MKVPQVRPTRLLILPRLDADPGQVVLQSPQGQRRNPHPAKLRSRKWRLLKREQSSKSRAPGPMMLKVIQFAAAAVGERQGLVPGDPERQGADHPSGIVRFGAMFGGYKD
jgi:hypothetical protein